MGLDISLVFCNEQGHTLLEGVSQTNPIIRIIRLIPPPRFGLLFLFLRSQRQTDPFIGQSYLLAVFSSQDPIGSQDNVILLQLDRTIGSFSSPVNEDLTTTGSLGLDLGLPPACQMASQWY